ncbi:MAG: calcium-binding protein [Burkholderiaceae bacterium]
MLTSFENLAGSTRDDYLYGDASASVVSGDAGDDWLFGRDGADTLKGEIGDDYLEGGDGADTLDGGAGSDWASYANSAAGVTVDVGLATAQTAAGDTLGDVFVSIENVLGSAFADTIISGSAANEIDGGAGIDTVSFVNSGAGVIADLANVGAQSSAGHAGGDVYTNVENLLGSAFGDVLRGDANANLLTGAGGADVLEGRAGADTLDGGAGIDTASYENSVAAVTVDLSLAAQTAAGDTLGDVYVDIENLRGSAYDDYVIATAGWAEIDGIEGSDTVSYEVGRRRRGRPRPGWPAGEPRGCLGQCAHRHREPARLGA